MTMLSLKMIVLMLRMTREVNRLSSLDEFMEHVLKSTCERSALAFSPGIHGPSATDL
jgi:hypothetical protein